MTIEMSSDVGCDGLSWRICRRLGRFVSAYFLREHERFGHDSATC